jgi:glucose dehydrogenase
MHGSAMGQLRSTGSQDEQGGVAPPVGTIRDQAPVPVPFKLGPMLGGPIVAGGGVAFLTGTLDDYLPAFDVEDEACSGKTGFRQVVSQRHDLRGQRTAICYG